MDKRKLDAWRDLAKALRDGAKRLDAEIGDMERELEKEATPKVSLRDQADWIRSARAVITRDEDGPWAKKSLADDCLLAAAATLERLRVEGGKLFSFEPPLPVAAYHGFLRSLGVEATP